MLTYNTTLPNAPPRGLPAPQIQSPYGRFGSAHSDVLASQMGSNNADYELAKARGELDYATKRQAAEQQLALSGLQQMAQAQQNRNALVNSRVGAVSSL
ncbi:MAG: hypothetical protein EBR82_46685, partial [Caulobacteraceae bacterium]|nr:hypothetical protein [Caulobacteraceae bacterium]